MNRFARALAAEWAAGARLLAPTRRAAYIWATFSLLSLLAVITGAGGLANLVAGILAAVIATLRLSQLAERDHRADVESWQADTRDADVAWWLDRLRYSDLTQERLAAHDLLTHWGVRSHLNPLESEADREARSTRILATHESVRMTTRYRQRERTR